MKPKEKIKTVYDNHIIRAEIATLAAYELTGTKSTQANDELAIAIHHLERAKTTLEQIRQESSNAE